MYQWFTNGSSFQLLCCQAKDAVARVHDAFKGLVRASSVHEASLDHVRRRGNLGNSHCKHQQQKVDTANPTRLSISLAENKQKCIVHITSYYIILQQITAYYSHFIASCYIILHRFASHYIMLHLITSYYIILHLITSCYIIFHHITSYYGKLNLIAPCYIILHIITSYYIS